MKAKTKQADYVFAFIKYSLLALFMAGVLLICKYANVINLS